MRFFIQAIAFIISIFFIGVYQVNAQNKISWKMQPIGISTRWADSVSPDHPLKEYPRPQMIRKNYWLNLNGLWQYKITDQESNIPTAFEGSILVPYPIESALSGVKKRLMPDQLLWYKRTFDKPKIKSNQKILLHFGAVDWKATVYINDKEVGVHTGGYTEFTFDITDKLIDGKNTILVKVYDPTDKGIGPHGKQVLNPGNIYYTPSSGIWQTVWLESVPNNYIKNFKLTPDVDKSQLLVEVHSSDSKYTGIVEIISPNGTTIKGNVDTKIVVPVNNAHLWSPNDPYLYDVNIRLVKDGKMVDEVKSYFGMRKISIGKSADGKSRILLNNKYVYNLGTLDQGFWPDGLYTAPTDDALSFDLKAIKAMGFNTVRKHIKIEPARWYYYADKLGLMVWQDFVNPNQSLPEGSKPEYERELLETMDQLHNNPSITTWVVFNERWGQYDQKRITELVKVTDPSRLVNGHSGELLYVNNQLHQPSDSPYQSSDMTDVHSYPYPRNPVLQPGKAQVVGEFGGIGVPIEGHLWDDLAAGWGYDGLVSPLMLKKQYSEMIDSLVALEKGGVSASIYTQPFDVETEQNGLITYDRKIAKLPLFVYHEINSKLLSSKKTPAFQLNVEIASNTILSFGERKKFFLDGKKDSAFLRQLAIMALENKDSSLATSVSDLYISKLRSPFAEINLKFIRKMTFNVSGSGFQIMKNNIGIIDSILGGNVAERSIMTCIYNSDIAPALNLQHVNLPELETDLTAKYGALGQERLWLTNVLYYLDKQDWTNFGKYYKLYFDKAIITGRNSLHINNMSWPVVENVIDTSVINTAIAAMRYSIDNFDQNDPYSFDTYANLLYKSGNKREALLWEAKALELSKNDPPFHESTQKVYQKMLNNEIPWK
ncbi:Glycosyl hydrolases family 2, TIM barrel domain [Chitinophaga sp. YR573]|uniref:glycoside hydrolase family 2 protein n=1 Tax=Chitinophaga sp. YR573 TaxID=1881040 RepID=UPI0008AF3B0E|nr:sugar-binding domain-containing protein [Chitinophaga sp. YR573]SEW21289.1 Glycosyl hydrolases family 2, TIM barrel domain [Chitinophaga sp. YR573]